MKLVKFLFIFGHDTALSPLRTAAPGPNNRKIKTDRLISTNCPLTDIFFYVVQHFNDDWYFPVMRHQFIFTFFEFVQLI